MKKSILDLKSTKKKKLSEKKNVITFLAPNLGRFWHKTMISTICATFITSYDTYFIGCDVRNSQPRSQPRYPDTVPHVRTRGRYFIFLIETVTEITTETVTVPISGFGVCLHLKFYHSYRSARKILSWKFTNIVRFLRLKIS